MDQFRIAADSSCNLLALDGADFVSVPLTIRTDAEEFRDDASLDVDAMVAALRATKGRSYSACPNIAPVGGGLRRARRRDRVYHHKRAFGQL